jgi:hypothetical protein
MAGENQIDFPRPGFHSWSLWKIIQVDKQVHGRYKVWVKPGQENLKVVTRISGPKNKFFRLASAPGCGHYLPGKPTQT